MTVLPGFKDICPSVTTVCPGRKPDAMTAVLSCTSATVTGLTETFRSAPIT
jgi:hypothetical protein